MEEDKKVEKKEDKLGEKKFIEREWTEEIEGHLDNDGFFITPNGSFWDPDYVYFNREGFDKHGGRYDEKGEYVPGKGWDEELNCYESEKEENSNDDDNIDDDIDDGNNIDQGYTEEEMMAELAQFDDGDDLFEGKDIIRNDPNIEIETVVQNENHYENEIKQNENKDNKGSSNKDINGNVIDERESDEYEEIEDEEVEDKKDNKKENKKEDNKEKKEGMNIKIEKEKKVFVVTTKDGNQFTINRDDDKDIKKNKIEDNNNNNNNNYDNENYKNKDNYYKERRYNNKNNYNYNYYNKNNYNYNNYYKNNKYNNRNNKQNIEYKNYNDFNDLDK